MYLALILYGFIGPESAFAYQKEVPPSQQGDKFIESVASEDLAIVKEKLKNCKCVNTRHTASAITPILAAINAGDMELLKLLLENGADPNMAGFSDGKIPLYYLLVQKTTVQIDPKENLKTAELLYQYGADVNAIPNRYNINSILHDVLSSDLRGDVSLWLLSKPEIKLTRRSDGASPLEIAVRVKRSDLTSKIIALGADVNYVNPIGQTALFAAIDNENIDAINILLAHGAKGNLKDFRGESVLHSLARRPSAPFSSQLLDKIIGMAKDNIDEKSDMGVSPVFIAAMFGNDKLFMSLIEKGANIHDVDNSGSPILKEIMIQGVTSGQSVILQYLIDAGEMSKISIEDQKKALKTKMMLVGMSPCLSEGIRQVMIFESGIRALGNEGTSNENWAKWLRGIRHNASLARPRSFQCDEAAKVALEYELKFKLSEIGVEDISRQYTTDVIAPDGC